MNIQNDVNREQRDYKNVRPKQNKRVRLAIKWGKNTFIYIVQTKKNSNFKRFHRTKTKIKTVTRNLANKHLYQNIYRLIKERNKDINSDLDRYIQFLYSTVYKDITVKNIRNS